MNKTLQRINESSSQLCRQPRRHKLALLTFVGLLAPVYFIPPMLASMVNAPRPLIVSAAVAVIVLLMTYVIMPLLTHIAASWLIEKPSREMETDRVLSK